MECNSEVRRHSFLRQNPKLTEVFSPRASRSSKPREKDKASQRHTVAQDTTDGRPLFPPRFPGNYQKLWPSRVSVDAEELVKHMSNVPVYLQRAQRGGNVQEKALNFGVLDWRRLETWTDNHRRATVNRGDASASPASSNASSSFSPFGSSSQSCRSSASSYPCQMNQSPSVNHHRDSCAEDDHSHISQEQTPRLSHDTGSHLPEVTSRKCPVRRRISFSIERGQRLDSLATKCEGNKQDGPDSEDVCDRLGPSSAARVLPSGSQNCEISISVNEKMKPHQLRSDFRKRSGDLGLACHGLPPCFSEDCPQDHHSRPSQLDGGPLDHFQESSQGNRRFSFTSTMNCTTPTEPDRASFVGTFPSEDFHSVHLSPGAPHSCPLSSNIHANGWSDMNASGSDLGERSFPLHSIKSPRNSNEVAMLKLDGWHGKHDECAIKLQKSFAAETPGRWHRNVKKAFTGGRDTLRSSRSIAGLTRSSSLRESSDIKQGKWAHPGSQNPEKETDITRSRRSPLKRLLDPLLKTKAFNVSHVATLTAGSPRRSTHEKKVLTEENLASNQGPQSLFNMTTRSSGGDTVKGSTPSSYIPMEIEDSMYDEKHEASSKQALLQLTWKNGLPLFTLSINETDILAATRKRDTSSKEGCECIYTFYCIRENKKKTGGWINQGNKGRRKELASNIVGQMNVSCLKCPKNHFMVREFILFGPELRPTDRGTLDPVPNSELAAIVLRVPEENTESLLDTLPPIRRSSCVLRSNLETKKHACSPGENSGSGQAFGKNSPKMVAILPSEVHGLSDTGKPATLVERWKSGGLCDCAGWDVGCSLTILTNNLQDSMPGSVQSYNAIDGRHRVDLFIQGGGQERKPLLSLVALGEGLYTVDFHTSVEVLQAFSVCIAILHGRKPRGPYELQGSRLCKSMEGFLVKNLAGKQTNSSVPVPYHPPFSPVGRA